MFPELQKKLVRLYTFSTGMILTFILTVTFLFYLSSQQSRREASFSDHIFTLTSKLCQIRIAESGVCLEL